MPLRISLPAPTYLPARRANTIQVMKMGQALTQLGHAVHVLVPLPEGVHPGGEAPAWRELAEQYGLRAEFPVTWIPVRPERRSYDFGWKAVRWSRRWKADLLYTRHPQTAALSSLLGRATILEVHDYPQGRGGPWLLRAFLLGRGKRRLVAITRALGQDLENHFRVRGDLLVAPDAVDLDRYTVLPEPSVARQWPESRVPIEDRFTVGYTGHLYPGRGVGLILDIAARLPEIQFLLVGGAPEDAARVRAQAGERSLSNVVLAGFVPNAVLPEYQSACDILLMPYQRRVSASSGGDIAAYLSPMKMFEYLACGRPILASDLPVLREVLDEGNAVLLPPDDAAAWVEAIRRLERSPAECAALSRSARATAGKHTWKRRAAQILDLPHLR